LKQKTQDQAFSLKKLVQYNMGLEEKCTKLTSEVDALREGNQATLQMCLEMKK
jgi:cell division protein FtsB